MTPFTYYKRIFFTNIDPGTTTIWASVDELSLLYVQFTNLDCSGAESIEVFVDSLSGTNEEIRIAMCDGSDKLESYPAIVPAGARVRITSIGVDDAAGTLHAFRVQNTSEG